MRLETERLVIRRWQQADLADLYAYASNPKLAETSGMEAPKSLAECQKVLDNFIEKPYGFAIVHKTDNKVIGSIALNKDITRIYKRFEDSLMLGFVLSESYWGQGIMGEASKALMAYTFENLQTKVLAIGHFTTNSQSKRVIEKLGFIYEGTFRKALEQFDGRVESVLSYSLLQDEYFELYGKVLNLYLKI